jgi:hypothetical protein
MPRYAAFLRGVSPMNARMPALKACFEAAGFSNVRTLLSSGNVVFDARSSSPAALERRAEKAMQAARKQAKGYAEAIPDEWPPFLSLLLQRAAESEDPYKRFLRRLASTPVANIEVGPKREREQRDLDDQVSKEAAKRAYFQTVEVAKQVLTDARLGKSVITGSHAVPAPSPARPGSAPPRPCSSKAP